MLDGIFHNPHYSIPGLAIIFFFYGPWKNLIIDLVHYRLLDIRHELILLQAQNRMPKNEFNLVLDFLREVTIGVSNGSWLKAVLFLITTKHHVTEDGLAIPTELDVEPTRMKTFTSETSHFLIEATFLHLAGIIFKSPFLLVISIISLPILIPYMLFQYAVYTSRPERITSAALKLGRLLRLQHN